MNSGFEDFEAVDPQSLTNEKPLKLPSGLILTVGLFPESPPVAIARASSEQGEHGFQYLSIGVNEISFNQTFIKLPESSKFTTVEFTLWAESDIPDPKLNLELQVVFHLDAGLSEQKVCKASGGSKLLVKYDAPLGHYITDLRLANVARGEGSIAYDSMRWSE